MTNNDETKILVELIKMNEVNTNKKLDLMGSKLTEHIDDNKNDFNEIKDLIKDLNHNMTNGIHEIYEETIKPMKRKIESNANDIRELKNTSVQYIRKEICINNEKMIKEHFYSVIKKIVLVNIIYLILYAIIIANSNIIIDWAGVFSIMGTLKKIF